MESDYSEFLCSICCEILKNPVIISTCKHSFCEICLNNYISKTKGVKKECPIDKLKFTKKNIKNDDIKLEQMKKINKK